MKLWPGNKASIRSNSVSLWQSSFSRSRTEISGVFSDFLDGWKYILIAKNWYQFNSLQKCQCCIHSEYYFSGNKKPRVKLEIEISGQFSFNKFQPRDLSSSGDLTFDRSKHSGYHGWSYEPARRLLFYRTPSVFGKVPSLDLKLAGSSATS